MKISIPREYLDGLPPEVMEAGFIIDATAYTEIQSLFYCYLKAGQKFPFTSKCGRITCDKQFYGIILKSIADNQQRRRDREANQFNHQTKLF